MIQSEKELYYWIKLHLLLGASKNAGKELISHFGKAEEIFKSSIKDLIHIGGMRENKAKAILQTDSSLEKSIAREINLIRKENVKILSILDREYPKNLRHIFDPPILIYMKGTLKKGDHISVALVGSRNASSYGKILGEKFGRELAANRVTVVSGLARGVDSAAHRGAIKENGRTIAVLGSGIDVIYPKENERLFYEIIEQGAIISEFPMNTPPRSQNFPRRNRLISALSLGVIIVEGSTRSGSLITARCAVEQGREVFAVPGSILSLKSKGPHRLIKEGAKLVENVQDIIQEIMPQIDKESILEGNAHEKMIESLDKSEREVWQILSSEPLHIDTISFKSKIKPVDINSILISLELKGMIKQLPGKMYVRIL